MSTRDAFKRSDRCVNCGRSAEQHDAQMKCPGSGNFHFATMNLPSSLTCGDCENFHFCEPMISRISADEVCDWYPARFVGPVRREA